MVSFEEYQRRFGQYGFTIKTTKEDFTKEIEELKKNGDNHCNIKFKVVGPCCESEYEVTWYVLKNKKNKRCSDCNNKAKGREKMVPFEKYKEMFCSYGIIMLSEEEDYYRGGEEGKKGMVRYLAHILARCDHERKTTFENFVKTEDGYGICENCRGKRKYRVDLSYSSMVEMLEKHGCKMVTSEEDFLYNELNIFRPIEIIGSCGHKSEELFNDIPFEQGKQTPCQECREAKAAATRERLINPDTNRLRVLEVEDEASSWIKSLLNDKFEVLITNEGCKADMAIRPLESSEDEWAMIQLKSASKTKDGENSYSFAFNKNDYRGMALVCTAKTADAIWILDAAEMKDFVGTSITLGANNKYFKYRVPPCYFANEIEEMFVDNRLKKMTIMEIMKRHYKSIEAEDIYQKLRVANIPFLKFEDVQNYCNSDFIVNGFKVQEKFAYKDHQQYNLNNLHKSNGKDNKVPYDKGDNDFYWVHLADWRLFYVIPEKVLIEHGYISDGPNKGQKHIGIYPKLYSEKTKKNEWITEYEFDYHNLDSSKLKAMFNKP
jgi:hypothetical protein